MVDTPLQYVITRHAPPPNRLKVPVSFAQQYTNLASTLAREALWKDYLTKFSFTASKHQLAALQDGWSRLRTITVAHECNDSLQSAEDTISAADAAALGTPGVTPPPLFYWELNLWEEVCYAYFPFPDWLVAPSSSATSPQPRPVSDAPDVWLPLALMKRLPLLRGANSFVPVQHRKFFMNNVKLSQLATPDGTDDQLRSATDPSALALSSFPADDDPQYGDQRPVKESKETAPDSGETDDETKLPEATKRAVYCRREPMDLLPLLFYWWKTSRNVVLPTRPSLFVEPSNWRQQAVHVLGSGYWIRAKDTILQSCVGSSFCSLARLPLTETGAVFFEAIHEVSLLARRPSNRTHDKLVKPLTRKPQNRRGSRGVHALQTTEEVQDKTNMWAAKASELLDSLMDQQLKEEEGQQLPKGHTAERAESSDNHFRGRVPYESPYWIAVDTLTKRWGVTIPQASSACPICIAGRQYVNAEDTSDASRFNALTCSPARVHQVVGLFGLKSCSWEFSADLLAVYEKHVEANGATHRASPGDSKFRVPSTQPAQKPHLWVSLHMVRAAGWSVRHGALLIHVKRSAIMTRGSLAPHIHQTSVFHSRKPLESYMRVSDTGTPSASMEAYCSDAIRKDPNQFIPLMEHMEASPDTLVNAEELCDDHALASVIAYAPLIILRSPRRLLDGAQVGADSQKNEDASQSSEPAATPPRVSDGADADFYEGFLESATAPQKQQQPAKPLPPPLPPLSDAQRTAFIKRYVEESYRVHSSLLNAAFRVLLWLSLHGSGQSSSSAAQSKPKNSPHGIKTCWVSERFLKDEPSVKQKRKTLAVTVVLKGSYLPTGLGVAEEQNFSVTLYPLSQLKVPAHVMNDISVSEEAL